MGWKSIKQHYGIEHIVAIHDGVLCIGSPYVHNLLTISNDGKVSWGSLGPRGNDELTRYYKEMTADLEKLKELIAAVDVFTESIPVYTFTDKGIEEKFCEKKGWPNVTHDGCVMYDNTFSTDKMEIVRDAKRSLTNSAKYAQEVVDGKAKEMAEWAQRKTDSEMKLADLMAQYPEK